jgi:hypothetical protein
VSYPYQLLSGQPSWLVAATIHVNWVSVRFHKGCWNMKYLFLKLHPGHQCLRWTAKWALHLKYTYTFHWYGNENTELCCASLNKTISFQFLLSVSYVDSLSFLRVPSPCCGIICVVVLFYVMISILEPWVTGLLMVFYWYCLSGHVPLHCYGVQHNW